MRGERKRVLRGTHFPSGEANDVVHRRMVPRRADTLGEQADTATLPGREVGERVPGEQCRGQLSVGQVHVFDAVHQTGHDSARTGTGHRDSDRVARCEYPRTERAAVIADKDAATL